MCGALVVHMVRMVVKGIYYHTSHSGQNCTSTTDVIHSMHSDRGATTCNYPNLIIES